jgi:hypothetical protein
MKKVFTLTFLLITVSMMADPVGIDKARGKAASFLNSASPARTRGQSVCSSEMSLREVDAGFDHLYVFNNVEGGGFVVVSADDKTDAVLAYSESGSYDSQQGNEALNDILAGLNGEVAAVAASPFFTARNDTEIQEQDREPVSPMITTCWNQYDPYYHFCPTDPDSGNPTLVGCVALTLAQLMKYYKYPVQTTVTIPAYTTQNGIEMPALPPTTFNYDLMNDYYVWDSFEPNYTPGQLEAVQKLLKYAGCALEMQYSSMGSASVFDVARIAQYFGYRSDARVLYAGQYPRAAWEQMVYNELASGRPVPYSAGAVLQQSHSFIIDGYDGRGYFHAVTGEYGYFQGNFYCKLHVINDCELQTSPVEFSGYNVFQWAVFGFQPADSTLPLQDLTDGEDMTGKLSKLEIESVEFYNPYAGQKTVAIINHRNAGETFENNLFLWQGDVLKGGAGSYVSPGQAGDVVVCFATPQEPGTYPMRVTSDWDGENVLYETTLEVTPPRVVELQANVTLEGFKGMYLQKETSDDGSVQNIWSYDETWEHEIGIYESLKIEADITNVGKESYNSWLETSLSENEQDENGNLLSANSLAKIAHMYYLNLAPGETRHYTFFYDKHSFSPDKVYFFYLDYNRNYEFGALFTLPWFCKYFATDPSKSEVVEQLKDTTDDSPVYNLQGIAQRGKQLRPGIYISGGKKVVVR